MRYQSVITITFVWLCFMPTVASPQVRGFTVPARTSVPFTYCISYRLDPDNASFLEQLNASPPDLFHLSYHIPFKGALGPTYGADLFTDDILSPDQIPREVERIQGVLNNMRAAGVKRLIPYVYTMAFFGDPAQRTGFFRFYDRWDDYRGFGLGPQPSADPTLWSQVRGPRPLGNAPPDVLHYEPCINHPAWSQYLDLVVRELAAVGYDGMFFDVNTLYCYCPHCQEKFDIYLLEKYGREGLRDFFGTDDHRLLDIPTIYRDFEDTILRAFEAHIAEIWDRDDLGDTLGAGNPGEVSLGDDWRLLRCYMQGSQGEYPPGEDFQKYLSDRFGGLRASDVQAEDRERFDQTVLRRHFHNFLQSQALADLLSARFGSADIRRRCLGKPRDMLLWVETQRFWGESMAAMFARLKNVGRETFAMQGRDDDFYTVANLGGMSSLDALNKRRVNAIDLARWAPVADMQMFEEMNQPGSLESGVIISNIFAFRWAMAAGTRAGTLLYKVTDDRAADLAHAEVAAGGGGAFIQAGLTAPESRKRWKGFFADNAELWEGGNSWARVGLLFWSDQVHYESPEHLALVRRLVHVLSENQVPFDIITEEGLVSMARYEVVMAPALRYLDDAQVASFVDYVERGGNLVVVEPFGTSDKYARPRSTDPLAGSCPTSSDFGPVSLGVGHLLRLKSDVVPGRQSDLWCLMEERANALVRAREYLDKARKADLDGGVDLGAGFVRRLEESLHVQLRWCPVRTDPGVFVHAYRLPPKPDRPERLVVHAVNYRVPILLERGPGKNGDPAWSTATKSGEPVVSRDLSVTVPLPRRAKVKDVKAMSPTDRPGSVRWSVENDRLTVALPRLDIYQAIVVELEASPGR